MTQSVWTMQLHPFYLEIVAALRPPIITAIITKTMKEAIRKQISISQCRGQFIWILLCLLLNQPLFTTHGSNLWIPTHGLLHLHWKANGCFPFNTPNAQKAERERERERDLKAQQIQLHN